MVVADLEYHQNRNLNDDGSVGWVQRNIASVSRDIFGEYGRNSVRSALKRLQEKGYLEICESRAGDNAGQFYRLNVESINAALNAYQRENKSRTPPKLKGVKNGGVLPQERHAPPPENSMGGPPNLTRSLEEKIRKRGSSMVVAAAASDCSETEDPRDVLDSHPKSVAAMRKIEPLRSEDGIQLMYRTIKACAGYSDEQIANCIGILPGQKTLGFWAHALPDVLFGRFGPPADSGETTDGLELLGARRTTRAG